MAKAHGNDLQKIIDAMPAQEKLDTSRRFWAKVQKPYGAGTVPCWYWKAAKNEKDNTPVFSIHKQAYRATRVVFAMIYGNLNPSLQVNHTCNGGNDCVNPYHLVQENGTNAILNNRRKRRAGSSRNTVPEWYKEVPVQDAVQHEGQPASLAASATGELQTHTG